MRIVRWATVLALASLPLLPSTAGARHASGPCDMHRGDDEGIRRFSARQITCAAETLGPVPGGADRALCIAKRESGLFPDARSETGMYLGLYQHAAEYWDWRYDTFTKRVWDLPTWALKGRTNAIVAIGMVVEYGTWGAAGWPRGDC